MAREKIPNPKLKDDFRPIGGLPVLARNYKDWREMGKQFSVDVNYLIWFNFHTNVPEEVNYYLRTRVGCFKSNDGGLNWAFTQAPGIVFIPLSPASTVVEPKDRFKEALDALEQKVKVDLNVRRHWLLCWIAKLKAGGDDRVIQWYKICPGTSGALGAAFVLGDCVFDKRGLPVKQAALEAAISSVQDVEIADRKLNFITSMREYILRTNILLPSEHLKGFNELRDDVTRTITKLDQWAGADSKWSGVQGTAMTKAYLSIREWIRRRQADPNSVYSCG